MINRVLFAGRITSTPVFDEAHQRLVFDFEVGHPAPGGGREPLSLTLPVRIEGRRGASLQRYLDTGKPLTLEGHLVRADGQVALEVTHLNWLGDGVETLYLDQIARHEAAAEAMAA